MDSEPKEKDLPTHSRRSVLKAGAAATIAGLLGLRSHQNHAESSGSKNAALENKVVIPGIAKADTNSKSTPDQETITPPEIDLSNFPWKKDEILMGPDAGFTQARNGEPIKVYIDPRVRKLISNDSFNQWDTFAKKMGRKNDLFAYVNEAPGSQIFVLPSPDGTTFIDPFDSKYGQYKTNPQGPFSWVNIQCATDDNRPIDDKTLLHEIGHALGFVDFVTKFMYENPESLRRYINAQPGFLEDKPIKSVLNYGGEYIKEGLLGPDDAKLLKLGGYLT